MVLRTSVGPKTDEVTGNLKEITTKNIKLVLFARCYPGEQTKKNEMDGACGTYDRERERGVYRLVVGKPETKRPFGKPRCRWENYINRTYDRQTEREREEVHTGLLWGILRKRDHLENLGVYGRITLISIFQEIGWEGVNWICSGSE
jgi:hypothetical protein